MDGRALITTVGEKRFRVVSKRVTDGYNTARIEFITDAVVTEEEEIGEQHCHCRCMHENGAFLWCVHRFQIAKFRVFNLYLQICNGRLSTNLKVVHNRTSLIEKWCSRWAKDNFCHCSPILARVDVPYKHKFATPGLTLLNTRKLLALSWIHMQIMFAAHGLLLLSVPRLDYNKSGLSGFHIGQRSRQRIPGLYLTFWDTWLE